jgi:hypothetical protein
MATTMSLVSFDAVSPLIEYAATPKALPSVIAAATVFSNVRRASASGTIVTTSTFSNGTSRLRGCCHSPVLLYDVVAQPAAARPNMHAHRTPTIRWFFLNAISESPALKQEIVFPVVLHADH